MPLKLIPEGESNTNQASNTPPTNTKLQLKSEEELSPEKGNAIFGKGVTSLEDPNKYNFQTKTNIDNYEFAAQDEGRLKKLGKGLANTGTQLLFDTMKDTSYLLDWQQVGNLATGKEQEFGNWFSTLMDKAEQSTHLDVYRTKESQGFHPESAGWWADAMPSIASSLSFLIPVEGAVGALGLVGKAVGETRSLKALKAIGLGVEEAQGLSGAVISRYMENTMEGKQTFDQTYQEALQKGATEDKAREVAGEAARKNWYLNSVMLMQDIPQYMTLFKGFKGASELFGKAGTKVGSIISEMGEEGYQFISDKESRRQALLNGSLIKDDKTSFTDRMKDYASDPEFWNATSLGGIGAGVFEGIAEYKDHKTQNKFDAVLQQHRGVLVGDEQEFNRGTDRAFSDKLIESTANKGGLEKLYSDLTFIKNNPERIDDVKQRQEVSENIDNRIKQVEFAHNAFQTVNAIQDFTPEMKGLVVSTLVNQKVSEDRISDINKDLNKAIVEDQLALSISDPSLHNYKIAKLTLESIKDNLKLQEEAKTLQKTIDQVSKDILKAYPEFNTLEDVDKSLISTKDVELKKLLKNKAIENNNLKEAKDILYKLNTEEGKKDLEEELNKHKEEKTKREKEEKAANSTTPIDEKDKDETITSDQKNQEFQVGKKVQFRGNGKRYKIDDIVKDNEGETYVQLEGDQGLYHTSDFLIPYVQPHEGKEYVFSNYNMNDPYTGERADGSGIHALGTKEKIEKILNSVPPEELTKRTRIRLTKDVSVKGNIEEGNKHWMGQNPKEEKVTPTPNTDLDIVYELQDDNGEWFDASHGSHSNKYVVVQPTGETKPFHFNEETREQAKKLFNEKKDSTSPELALSDEKISDLIEQQEKLDKINNIFKNIYAEKGEVFIPATILKNNYGVDVFAKKGTFDTLPVNSVKPNLTQVSKANIGGDFFIFDTLDSKSVDGIKQIGTIETLSKGQSLLNQVENPSNFLSALTSRYIALGQEPNGETFLFSVDTPLFTNETLTSILSDILSKESISKDEANKINDDINSKLHIISPKGTRLELKIDVKNDKFSKLQIVASRDNKKTYYDIPANKSTTLESLSKNANKAGLAYITPTSFRQSIPNTPQTRSLKGEELANKFVSNVTPNVFHYSKLQVDVTIAPKTSITHTTSVKSNVPVSPNLATWNLGILEGTDKKEAQKETNRLVRNPDEVVKDGESFNQFKDRAINEIKNQLANAPDKTLLVVHSQIFKLIDSYNFVDDVFDTEKYLKETVKPTALIKKTSNNGDLYLVRHGDTMQNKGTAGPELVRTKDVKLAPEGVKEAHEVAKELLPIGISNIISSPLDRTIQTANIIKEELDKATPKKESSNRIEELKSKLSEGTLPLSERITLNKELKELEKERLKGKTLTSEEDEIEGEQPLNKVATQEKARVLIDISQAEENIKKLITPKDIITFDDINQVLKNIENGGTTWGFMYNRIIGLNNAAEAGTEFHETFHYIFRNLLDVHTISRLYIIAKIKFGTPSKEQLKDLRNQSSANKLLYKDQLESLWYEEKMADSFMEWKKKDISLDKLGLIGKIFKKIQAFVKWAIGNNTELEALFGKINEGSFKNSNILYNKRFPNFSSPTFKLIPSGEELIEGTDNKKFTYLPLQEGREIIRTITAKAIESTGDVDNILDSIISQEYLFNSPEKNLALLESIPSTEQQKVLDKLDQYQFIYSDPTSITIIKDEVKKQLETFDFTPKDVDFDEQVTDQENERATLDFDKNAINIGGLESLNKEIRRYIGTTLYNTTDLLGRPVRRAIDPQIVYQGIQRNLSSTSPGSMMNKLKVYSEYNEQSKALYNKLKADTNYDEILGIAKTSPQLLQRFINAFTTEKLDYLQILIKPESGENKIINANQKDAKHMQFSEWFRNFNNISQQYSETNVNKLIKASEMIISGDISKAGAIRIALSSVGIDVSDAYIKFSILKNANSTDPLVTQNSEAVAISEDDLTQIAKTLSKKENPFEELEEGKGNKGRILNIADNNAKFDETVLSSNFQDAKGKTRYSYIQPSLALERTRELKDTLNSQEGREAFKESLSKELIHDYSFNDGNFLLNHEKANQIFSNFKLEFTGDLRQEESGKEGTTFKSIDARSFKLMQYALFAKQANRNGLKVGKFYPKVLEAKASAYSIELPIEDFADKNGTPKNNAIEALYNQFLQEVKRINITQKEIENESIPKIKDYHIGKQRGLKLFYFKYLENSPLGEEILKRAKYEGSRASFSSIEEDIKEQIKLFVKNEISEEKRILSDLGVFNKDQNLLPSSLREFPYQSISNYYLNALINLNAYNDLIELNAAFSKDSVDNIKRSGRWVASKVSFGKGQHIVGFFKEPKAQGLTKEIDVADAQSYIDLNHFKFILNREGKLSQEIFDILNKIDDGDDLNWENEIQKLKDKQVMLNSIKTVTSGPVDYHKMSDFILIKKLTSEKNNKGEWIAKPGKEYLHNRRIELENLSRRATMAQNPDFQWNNNLTIDQINQIVPARLLPESASKLLTYKPADLQTDGRYNFDSSNTRLIENKYSGRQVDTPSGKTEIVYGTQLIQLIDSEQDDNTIVNFQGKDVKLGELRQIYQNLLSQARTNSVESAKKFLGKLIDGKLSEKEETKFRKKLLDTLEESGADDSLLQFFGLDPMYNLNLPNTLNKYEQLFLAHFSKGVLSQKTAGLKLTLVSGNGFNISDRKGGFRELQYNPNGLSEVALPAFTKELHNLQPGDTIPEELLKMFGVRIPTQDKHSMIAFKVVEFLPSEYGSIGIFPKEVIELSGADFDIDSIFVTRKDYYTIGDKLVPFGTAKTLESKWVEFKKDQEKNNKDLKSLLKVNGNDIEAALRDLQLPSNLEEFKKETKDGIITLSNATINNQLVDANIAFLTNKSMVEKGIPQTPATTARLSEVRDKIFDLLERDKNAQFTLNSPLGQYTAWKNNATGKENVGPAANTNLIRAFLYKAKVHLQKDTFRPIFNGDKFFDFSKNKDSQDKRIQDTLSTILSAMTDNAKDPLAGDLNLSLTSLGPALQLISLGVDLYDVMLLVNSPIVREYTEAIEATKTVIKSKKDQQISRFKIEEELMAKYKLKLSLDLTLSTKELEDSIKSKSNLSKALTVFTLLEDQGKYWQHLSKLLALNKGLPSTFQDTEAINEAIKAFKIDRPDEPIFEAAPFDIRKALKGTHIENNIELFKDIMEMSEHYFITQSPLFKDVIKDIEENIKDTISNKAGVLNDIKQDFLSYLSINAYLKGKPLNQDLLTGKDNITVKLADLTKEHPELKKNKLIRFLTVDKSNAIPILTANTRIKLSSSQIEELTDSFRELFNAPESKQFAKDLFEYLIVKDNLQFANNSFIKFISPFMFRKMSDTLDEVNNVLVNKGDAEKVFGQSLTQLKSNFKEIWFRNIENQEYLQILSEENYGIEYAINITGDFGNRKKNLVKYDENEQTHYKDVSTIGNSIQKPYGFKNTDEIVKNGKIDIRKSQALVDDNKEIKAIPLKENEDLYKKYNLLTEDGKIKTLPDNETTKKWLETLNQSPNYSFKLRKTTEGIKILIFDKSTSLANIEENAQEETPIEDVYSKYIDVPGETLSTTSILNNILSNLKDSPNFTKLTEFLLDIQEKNPTMKVKASNTFTPKILEDNKFSIEDKVMAFWNGVENTIYLSKEIIDSHTEGSFQRTFLHEVIHSYTNYPFYKEEEKRSEEEKEFVNSITSLYNEAKSLTENKDLYGYTNVLEFMSEIMSSSKFVGDVKSLNNRSIWEKIIDNIIKFFTGKETYKKDISEETSKLIYDYLDELDKVDPLKNLQIESRALKAKQKPTKPVESAYKEQYVFFKRRLLELSKEKLKYPTNSDKYTKIEVEIADINAKLNEAIKEDSHEVYLTLGKQTLDQIDNDVIKKLESGKTVSPEEIRYAKDVIEAFEDFIDLQDEADKLNNRLFPFIKKVITDQVEEHSTEKGDNKPTEEKIFNQDKDIGTWKAWVSALADSGNYIVRTIGMEIKKAQNSVETKNKQLLTTIQEHVDSIHEWAKKNEITSKDTYSVFIQEVNGTLELTRPNTTEFYNKLYESFKNIKSVDKKEEGRNWIKNNAIKGKDGEWTSINSKYNNPNYTKIQSTPELKSFYEFYQNQIQEHSKYLPKAFGKYFIPNDRKTTIGNILKKLIPIRRHIDGSLIVSEELEKDMLSMEYTKKLSSEEKSRDLGASLLKFGQFANNHTEMTDILPNLRLLQDGLIHKTDSKGNIIRREYVKSSEPGRQIDAEDTNLYKQVDTVIKMQVLGKMKLDQGKVELPDAKDEEGNTVKRYFLWSDVADILLKYNSILRIGASPITATSNLIMGDLSNIIEASGGRHFTLGNLVTASNIFFKQNFKVDSFMYKVLEKLNPLQETDDYSQISNVSLKSNVVSLEKVEQLMYWMQKSGEKWIQTRGAIAILLKQDYIDKEGNPTDKWNKATDKELTLLTNEIQAVNHMMQGRYSQKEAAAIQQNVMYRLLSQFRKWIPAYLESRFDEHKEWNNRLQAETEGRFRTLGRVVLKEALTNPLQAMENLLLPIINQKAALEKGELSEMEIYNMRKNMVEIAMWGVLAFTFALLHGGDDDEAKRRRKNPAIKLGLTLLNRACGDLGYFYKPTSGIDMANKAIPLATTAQTIVQAIKYVPSAFEGDKAYYQSGSRKGKHKLGSTIERITLGAKVIDEISRVANEQSMEELNK